MPTPYNPENAGKFDAIPSPAKSAEKPRPQPNYEKLAELKAAATKAREQKEAGIKTAELPQMDAARHMAQEIAVSGSPGKSFMEMSAADKAQLAKEMLQANAEMVEGRAAVDRGDTAPKPAEVAPMSQNAREMPVLTREQIRAAQDAQMKVVSPMSGSNDTMRVERPPAQAPAQAPKKKFFGLFG
ncbi:MAG: hypothetical protein NTX72_03975 [Candidatus Uhrbacteria bacterium]|nr:hypothetical protein [Candidatus Uhrbacteria bacterium]